MPIIMCVCVCVHCVGLRTSSQSNEMHTHTPQVQNMPPNTNHAHNKHVWRTIICNFSQVQVITPWWWTLCDPKYVGVIFNVSFRFLYNKILMSMTVIIECISWLINVTDNNDARWKPGINVKFMLLGVHGVSPCCHTNPSVYKGKKLNN